MSEQKSAFALLVLGALLFAAAVVLQANYGIDFAFEMEIFTILFGLPYAARELGRKTNWLLVLYFVVLIPAVHYAATQTAIRVHDDDASASIAMLVSGLAGGFVGSALSFALLFLRGLRADGRVVPLMAIGVLLLVLVGGFGLQQGMERSAGPEGYDLVIWLYLPWQIVFAYFLSRLLKPSPPKDAPAA